MYTFENRCIESPDLPLGDETTKIFLNTKGHVGNIPLPLKSFLHYIETNEATDDYTREMEKEVIQVRNDNEWRDRIMTLEQVLKDCEYDTDLKSTAKVTKKHVFNMLKQNLSNELICKIAEISEDQLAAYKAEYDNQKSE